MGEVVRQAHLRRLTRDVYGWIGAGGDSNAGAVETKDGLIVLDAQQNTALGRAFRESLRDELGKPVEKVINTHYHMDHIAGNVVFADEAPIIAHEKTVEKLHALLGKPNANGQWVVADTLTKVRAFYGPNASELIPDDDPAWDWFENRFAPPEFDAVTLCPPMQDTPASSSLRAEGAGGVSR